ncbi:hypothetical protein K431DRAFT_299688 [Polychaeton citri CBS 116435]|uniref:Uncharacterized protein n=1 Tax=Polychaeton citri CBS 116435 TaxID=1314669 RepID=A0A9P4QGR8_9PEZI|nr:hypothetical protein K431DRAFT_299688 [Polychaeton citri CBS 116435]
MTTDQHEMTAASVPYNDIQKGPPVTWLSRAERLSAFPANLQIQDLLVFVTTNAMTGNFFDLAIFKPNIAITSSGQVLTMTYEDVAAFALLSAKVGEQMQGGESFKIGTRKCRPNTILHVLVPDEIDGLKAKRVVVNGYTKVEWIEKGCEGMPVELGELLGLIEVENRRNKEQDLKVLGQLREVVKGSEGLEVPVRR